jgi:hypothetical protein
MKSIVGWVVLLRIMPSKNRVAFCHSERSERICICKRGTIRLFYLENTDSFAALRMTKKTNAELLIFWLKKS